MKRERNEGTEFINKGMKEDKKDQLEQNGWTGILIHHHR